jgi:hypothetical protein
MSLEVGMSQCLEDAAALGIMPCMMVAHHMNQPCLNTEAVWARGRACQIMHDMKYDLFPSTEGGVMNLKSTNRVFRWVGLLLKTPSTQHQFLQTFTTNATTGLHRGD